MKIIYDPEVDAVYFRFLEGDYECTTIRLNEDVAVNIAPGGKIVGIEVLDASENLNIIPGSPTIKLEKISSA
ncbi:DUF2283 domain-containing protein [Candidatus Sumerlaeota bacterium]|nr:DUF2283 domain-containing protein [Candidatus Sumerlaeota bacterium]